jgi:spore coat protein U-like protein
MGTRPYRPRVIALLRRACVSAALFAAIAGAPALAQSTQGPTGTNQAEAKIIVLRQLSFFRVQDLDFGDIIPGPTAGVVRIFPDGTRTVTGGVTVVGTTHQPARFAGLGSFNQQVLISVSSNTIDLTGPGTPMTLSQFDIGSTPTAILSTTPRRFRITSTNGQFNFPVGARLAVGANQTAGNYSGSFAITLNYQ